MDLRQKTLKTGHCSTFQNSLLCPVFRSLSGFPVFRDAVRTEHQSITTVSAVRRRLNFGIKLDFLSSVSVLFGVFRVFWGVLQSHWKAVSSKKRIVAQKSRIVAQKTRIVAIKGRTGWPAGEFGAGYLFYVV